MTTPFEAVANVESRFRSGNGIPVERAYMTRAEWDAFCNVIRQLTSDYAGWTPTGENLNALPEPLRKYIHDLHTASDNATLVRQEALTRAEYNILRKMIAEAPEGTVDGGWVQQTQPGHGALWVRIEGRDDLQAVKNKRVKLLEVGDE